MDFYLNQNHKDHKLLIHLLKLDLEIITTRIKIKINILTLTINGFDLILFDCFFNRVNDMQNI
jgi:hypothetical protein